MIDDESIPTRPARTTRPTLPSSRRYSSASGCSFMGNIAHKPDLGGKVPSTDSGDAAEAPGRPADPAARLPPRQGQFRRGGAHLRQRPHAGSDLGRHQGAGQHQHLWAEQVRGCSASTAPIPCSPAGSAGWIFAKPSCGKEIAKVPDGLYGPETDFLDDDGVELEKPHRISASLRVEGDMLRSSSTARGPINLRPCVSRNFIECLVKMVFIPAPAVNDGLSRRCACPIRRKARCSTRAFPRR